jgi:cell division protein FtsN
VDRIAKAVLVAVVLAFLPFATVHGQAPSPTTVATPVDESPASKPAAPSKRRVVSQADARACLDLQTNFEIIACAEKYR